MELLADVLGDFCADPRPRERTPIRRHSRLAGREGTFWRGMKRQDARQIVLAAKRYELKTRTYGRRNGALGAIAIEVLDYLANLMDYRTGRLDPSIDTMMNKLHRSRDAIVRALKALREHGFLDWIRRYEPTGGQGRGIQVQQTSNAYRLFLPKRALALLGRYFQAPPVPDDFSHAQQQHTAAIERHRASLDLAELALFDIGDNALGQSLARLGKLLQQRESAKRTESPSKLNIIGENDGLTPDID